MRNGPVRTRKAAELGTATFEALSFMKEYLKNTPGEIEDVRAAAENAKRRCENIGLVNGRLWDEHGVSWLIQLYTNFVQVGPDQPPVVVRPTPTPIPGGIAGSFGGDDTSPDESPAPFPPVETTVLKGKLAARFTLHTGDTSTQKAIGLWTKSEILASIGYKQAVIDGRVFVLNAWITLAGMLPDDDSIVHEYVSEEQLAALGLRGSDDE